MTMHAHDADRLMTLVLDAEATPDEAAELERQLAADPVLRERFAVWMGLFDAMGHVPAVHAPEGLVARVMSNIPHEGAPSGSKLPAASRILDVVSNEVSPIRRASRPMASLGVTMNDEIRTPFNKRKVWIGAGLAAIAVVVVGGYALDVPPGIKDTAGTILPATRYQAAQPKAADIQVGVPTGTQTSPIDPSIQAGVASQAAATQAGNQSALQAGSQSALQAGNQSAKQAGNQSALQAGNQSAKQAGSQSALQAGSQSAVQAGSQSALQAGSQSAVQAGSQSALQAGSQSALQAGSQSAVQAGSQSAIQAGSQSAVQAGSQSATQAGRTQ